VDRRTGKRKPYGRCLALAGSAIDGQETLTALGVPTQQHQPDLALHNLDYARAVAQP
jgi:hypothetical protein